MNLIRNLPKSRIQRRAGVRSIYAFDCLISFVIERTKCGNKWPCACSTFQTLMSDWAGRPTHCPVMSCAQRTPSCWSGSTATLLLSTPPARPLNSSWTSTATARSPRPGGLGVSLVLKTTVELFFHDHLWVQEDVLQMGVTVFLTS